MVSAWVYFLLLSSIANAFDIELLECDPPDLPVLGGYGPQQPTYLPGDVIHYYCDVDTHIGGNFYRKCEDTGRWSGHTPVCDLPTKFKSTSQSTTADDESGAELAVDEIRSTCTSTVGGRKEEWVGNFTEIGELIRVMLFLPKGPASFEVVLVKPNGEELVCGSQTKYIDRFEWTFQNCPGPHNLGASGLKIKSLSNDPLKICEIQAHVLTSPRCVDPSYRIENGRLRLSRKSATLVCSRGYTGSRVDKMKCVRDGEWERKDLHCIERRNEWELDSDDSDDDNERQPDFDPRVAKGPDRQKFKV